MAKVTLEIEETLKFVDEIVVEVPETLTEDQLQDVLNKLERECGDASSKDVAFSLKEKYGFQIVGQSYSFPDAPSSHELEIVAANYESENSAKKQSEV
ncbi:MULTISPECIES: hypothetical protein [Bacillus cereus group]|uniref:hypothetical protein n=1 Tax=Bacillus cereus group TaxID=86661 RepID=UPI000279F71D|nr:hypothetical protein [Bacillus cereus]EJR25252.1 hypothetical protein IIE_06289 [Bacillus cereus VD045]